VLYSTAEILHGPLYFLQRPLSYMGRLGFVGQGGGIRVRTLELSSVGSQFSDSMVSTLQCSSCEVR
jgi:hypothetical protein